MKKNDIFSDNLSDLFAKARFEVADDGFKNRVMQQLPFVMPTLNIRKMWKDVFRQVAVAVVLGAIFCLYLTKDFDYDKFSDGIVQRVAIVEKKTINFSNEITDKLNKTNQNEKTK